jgi:cytochrome b6-f complex iron-sulfur subunit
VATDPRAEQLETGGAKEASRRSFLGRLWLGLGGIVLAEYVWLFIEFLRPHPGPSGKAGVLVAGPVDQFDPGTVTAFPAGKLYLARLVDGGFLAVSRECTHLGCTVPWIAEEGRFVCPCHSSAYDIRGDVVSPPAPRALDLHPIRIENGIVKVDTGRTLKRRSFEPSQVVRA